MKAADGISKWLRGIGITAALSIGICIASALAQTAMPSGSLAIPVTEVITKSSELTTLLAGLTHRFASTDDLQGIKRLIPGLAQQIEIDFTDTSSILGSQPPLETLKGQHALWQGWHKCLYPDTSGTRSCRNGGNSSVALLIWIDCQVIC